MGIHINPDSEDKSFWRLTELVFSCECVAAVVFTDVPPFMLNWNISIAKDV